MTIDPSPRDDGPMSDEYFDLGTYSHRVTTSSPLAQQWFDRGLVWTYGFNHEEAVACFQRAVEADPNCAMAFWGIAYALGPNYNKPWEFFDETELGTVVERTHEAAVRARELAGSATPVEQALIGALVHRYPASTPDGPAGEAQTCAVWNVAFADAMRTVYDEHPEDLEVATLFADALMNLTPWALWDLVTGEPAPGSYALEIKDVLERAMTLPGGRDHPGLLHLFIHLVEMSSTPENGLPVANRLRDLVPDAGHLRHMPSHLDVLCGDYQQVITANLRAIEADEKFVDREGPMNFYTMYRCHDLHFAVYGAMFLGQSEIALTVVEQLERTIPDDLLHVDVPPMADWLEGFLGLRVHVYIRFGMWAELIALELPSDPELKCTTTALIHYGRGVAYAATGRVPEAEAERELFREAVRRVPESRILFNNTCRDILAVASAMLDGELQYRRGNIDAAFQHLRRSIALDDHLPYDEPWGWMQPTRHAYGALLLEQARVEEAEAVYRADLGYDDTLRRSVQHPRNVWSLHGYHECLTRLGKTGEAAIIGRELTLAAALADVPVVASCLCRLDVAGPPSHGCC